MIMPVVSQFAFTGELRNIHLFTFSIDLDEAQKHIPAPLQARNVRGRALVSMADIQMCRLRPLGCPAWSGLNYRHIVLRILIDDRRHSSGEQRGAWFFRSFVAQPWLAAMGNTCTEFNFCSAAISGGSGQLAVRHSGHTISCAWEYTPSACDASLLREVQTLDKAYSVRNGKVFCRSIERSSWQPVPATCRDFSCSWFESVQLEGLFVISCPVSYKWFAPKEVYV